jgi:hypothetical protein
LRQQACLAQNRLHGLRVQVVMFGDDDKLPFTRTAAPWLIELVAHSCPNGLNQKAHGLAPDRDIPFHTQDILFPSKADDSLCQCLGVVNLGQGYNRAVKVLMFVFVLTIMVRGPGGEVIFRRCVQAQNNGGVNGAVTDSQNGQGGAAPQPE